MSQFEMIGGGEPAPLDYNMVIRITVNLILNERAREAQRDYQHSKHYDQGKPISSTCSYLKGVAEDILRNKPVPKVDRQIVDLWAYVSQTFGVREKKES